MKQIEDLIGRLQANLRQGMFTNEAAVSQGVVLPLLAELGWPVFDTRVVAPEYTVGERRVDYALCCKNQPSVYLEIKRVGQVEGADRQLFEYAFHEGVPMAVLTDGQEWHIYLPAERGDYNSRRVYKLDLLERSVEESASRLKRYLDYEAVNSGKAFEDAKEDYRSVSRERQMRQALPDAWNRLLTEPDESVLELLAEKVADICGYKPDLETCAEFLSSISKSQPALVIPGQQRLAPAPPLRQAEASSSATTKRIGFVLNGQEHPCQSARNTISALLQILDQRDPTFLDRFAARKHGSKRRYVARKKEELYPGRPDLCENASYELREGWYMGTNHSKREYEHMARMVAEVAGLTFGYDLRIHLG